MFTSEHVSRVCTSSQLGREVRERVCPFTLDPSIQTWNVVRFHSSQPGRGVGLGREGVVTAVLPGSISLQESEYSPSSHDSECPSWCPDCGFMLKDCLRLHPKEIMLHKNDPRFSPKKSSWIKSKKYYCNCVS